MAAGRFITFEGIDGSGKTTQARRLAERLRAAGREVVLTREPGGSPGAEEIRRLLVEGATDRWSAQTEALLFTAARRDHLEKTIRPALEAGATVVCDRFADSTRVYQGAVRADLREMVDALHALMIGREPDLTIIVDVDAQTARARGQAKTADTRYESFGTDFQAALRDGFLALARAAPGRCRVVDGTRPEDDVAAEVAELAA